MPNARLSAEALKNVAERGATSPFPSLAALFLSCVGMLRSRIPGLSSLLREVRQIQAGIAALALKVVASLVQADASAASALLSQLSTTTLVSLTCGTIVLVLLILATLNVSLESVQYDLEALIFRRKSSDLTSSSLDKQEKQREQSPQQQRERRMSLSSLGSPQRPTNQGDDSASQKKHAAGGTRQEVKTPTLSPTSSNAISSTKSNSRPKSSWLPSIFSSRNKKARSETDASEAYSLSYNSQWSPSQSPPGSPQSLDSRSIIHDDSSVLSFSPPVRTERTSSWQAGDNEPRQVRGMNRAQTSGGEAGHTQGKENARSLIGYHVDVKGLGRGVVKGVKKDIFNRSVFEVEFPGGKVSKIMLKRGSNRFGLPFSVVDKVEAR